MTVPLRSWLTGRDKNMTVAVVVGTLVPKRMTAAELEVKISVSLANAETEIGVDVVEVRDGRTGCWGQIWVSELNSGNSAVVSKAAKCLQSLQDTDFDLRKVTHHDCCKAER